MSVEGHVLAGRYRLGGQLGRGGMSTVYRAFDESLGRAVAIKILSPLASDPSAVERVRSEIRVLASLSHRNLVTLYDASSDTVDGVEKTFLVMELVDGPSLAERLLGGPLADEEARHLLREMAGALQAIHARGIIHRDIKPGNILLAPSGTGGRAFDAKLADFGIAVLADRTSDLTAAGTVIGTAAYLSPEQPRGEPATAASDIYSLGIVLLEALTGGHPFPGTLAETVAARLSRSPDIPAALPYSWRSLLGSMTAMSPRDRPTAADVLERLDGDGAPARTALMTDVLAPDARDAPATLPMPHDAATELLPRTPEQEQEQEPEPESGSGTARRSRRRRNAIVGVVLAAVVGAAAVGAAVASPFGNPTPADPTPSTSATPAASPAPSPSSSATPSPSPSASETSAPAVPPAPTTVSPTTPAPVPPAPAATTNGNGNGNGKSNGNGNGNSGGNGKGKNK